MNTTTKKTTTFTLKTETVEHLQELVQINRDSAEGFQHVASRTDNPVLAPLFRELALERTQFARELEPHIRANHETPPKKSSWTAKIHRWWIDARSWLPSDSTYAILDEVERGEDSIKETYTRLTRETGGSAIQPILASQYQKLVEAHDRIRALRDAAKSRKSS